MNVLSKIEYLAGNCEAAASAAVTREPPAGLADQASGHT